MSNYGEMVVIKDKLISYGHNVIIPVPVLCRHLKAIENGSYIDTHLLKIKHNYIKDHCGNIMKSDVILVANRSKKNIDNYIGGNTFLEMGFAYIMGKKIYLMNPVPKIDLIYEEILAMRPNILNGNLNLFKR